jgi:hypothetical protein
MPRATPRITPTRRPPKRLETWAAHARRFGISTKALDNWVARGIVPPAEVINGRKYGSADTTPRRDPVA